MAMSRKHYVEAAKVIKGNLEDFQVDSASGTIFNMAESIANDLADMFKRDNSAFDRARFMDACGMGE